MAIGILAIGFLASGRPAGAQGFDMTAPREVPRWESTLSAGGVSTGRAGVVKSLRWYAVPRVIGVGMSVDFISEAIPIALHVVVSAPFRDLAPFVCAGAGGALNGCGISYYGAGVKLRLRGSFGLVGEYRHYNYGVVASSFPPRKEKESAGYIGAGIAWVY
jgi:hypothetical protein